MPIKNGEKYISSINRLKPTILYKGGPISGNLSEHIAFRGLISTQASLYDMQGNEKYIDKMTFVSPHTGEPVGLSFLVPKTKNDLKKRREMMSLWARESHGFLGRSPDYMNTTIMAYSSAADVLMQFNPEYAENLKNYYVYCRERDITLSHAFVQPAGSRFIDLAEDTIAAKVHEINQDEMVVSGAFLMATGAGTSDEIFVLANPLTLFFEDASPHTFAFAIPTNLPGVTLVCRESFVHGDSSFNYPLSSRFEEMDTLVLFDHVRVPRDRIFLFGDARAANELKRESQFYTQVSHQTLCRYIAKTEFFLGAAENLADLTNDNMNGQISEILVILEILKGLLIQAEAKAKKNRWDVLVPDKNTMLVVNRYFPEIYPRMLEIIQTLASSRIVMIPSEEDFQNDMSQNLKKYLSISDADAHEVVALNRLAWELSSSSFACRQLQYERYFFGSPKTVTNRLYESYEGKEQLIEDVKNFLKL